VRWRRAANRIPSRALSRLDIESQEDAMNARRNPTRPTIARIWRGRTTLAKAEAYARYSQEQVANGLGQKALSVLMLREDRAEDALFETISFWESVEAMSRYAGDDPRRIHHLPRDRELLLELPDRVQVLDIYASFGRTEVENA
jgi:hypothetical protein